MLDAEDCYEDSYQEVGDVPLVTFSSSSIPGEGPWRMPTLYKGTLMWSIGWDGTQIVIVHGFTEGSQQIKTRAVYENSSSRDIVRQAHLEIRQRFSKMLRKGYTESLNELSLFQPMLATAYDPKKPMKFPVYTQAKIDGVRALSHKTPNCSIELYSREGTKWLWLEKLKEQVFDLFKYLPSPSVIDGELYSEDINFNQIISAVRTTLRKSPLNDLIHYYIFDLIVLEKQDSLDYEARYLILRDAFESALQDNVDLSLLQLLPAHIASSHEDIKTAHNDYVSSGYEGAIVRRSIKSGDNPSRCIYKCSRCINLVKVKTFKDEEGTVVGVTSGEGSEEGLALLIIRDDRGNDFIVRPRGTFDMRREWLTSSDDLVGRRYTYRYFELTEYGIPRFPVGVAFRDYE